MDILPQHSTLPVRLRRAGESGVAAVLSMAAHHGLRLSFAELQALLELDDLRLDTLHTLHVCRSLGFSVALLEGDFDQLPDVALPLILVLREGEGSSFRILYEAGPSEVVIGDHDSGRRRTCSRDEVVAQWTGEVIQAVPEHLDEVERRLTALRAWPRRWLTAAGLRADVRTSVALGATLLAAVIAMAMASVATSGVGRVMPALICALFLLAIWPARAWGCRACAQATTLVGSFPVGGAGAAFYAVLLGSTPTLASSALLPIGLAWAVGGHLALLAVLLQARVGCSRCLTAALLAFTAFGLAFASGPVSAATAGLVTLAGAISMAAAVLAGRALGSRRAALAARKATDTAFDGHAPPSPGSVQLAVYRRSGCAVCTLFEVAMGPALLEREGAAFEMIELDAGELPLPTPFLVVRGARTAVMSGFDPETGFDALSGLIDAARGSLA